MESNKIVKITCLTLFVSVIALLLVAGTYAKYTSSATGSDTATVAKWDIKAGVKDNELSITGSNATVTFNLFETILDEDGTTENDVVKDENGKVVKIAPGTSGIFELSIVNDSEVNTEYSITFEIDDSKLPEGTSLPLEFKVGDGNWTSSLSEVSTTSLGMDDKDTIDVHEGSAIVKVQWRWVYESITGDSNDTTLGINAPEIEVNATLTVSQVD